MLLASIYIAVKMYLNDEKWRVSLLASLPQHTTTRPMQSYLLEDTGTTNANDDYGEQLSEGNFDIPKWKVSRCGLWIYARLAKIGLAFGIIISVTGLILGLYALGISLDKSYYSQVAFDATFNYPVKNIYGEKIHRVAFAGDSLCPDADDTETIMMKSVRSNRPKVQILLLDNLFIFANIWLGW